MGALDRVRRMMKEGADGEALVFLHPRALYLGPLTLERGEFRALGKPQLGGVPLPLRQVELLIPPHPGLRQGGGPRKNLRQALSRRRLENETRGKGMTLFLLRPEGWPGEALARALYGEENAAASRMEVHRLRERSPSLPCGLP